MNQNEETNNDLQNAVNAIDPAQEENSTIDKNQPSAVAQIVNDISAVPSEILESINPIEIKGESAETTQIAETPFSLLAPEPSETGVYRLPNAMVHKPYKTEIDLVDLKIRDFTIYPNFEDQSKRLGLSVRRDCNVLQIEGIPVSDADGEHTLFLDYTYDEQRVHRKKIILLINPDPKSLWKTLEPDEGLPYRKEHTATDQASSEDFKIITASRRGRSHAHESKFREDDFAVYIENGWHILIVADGAGSARLSRQGSLLACERGLESLRQSIAELLEPKFTELMTEFASAKTEMFEKEIKNLLYQVLCGSAFAAYKRLEQESASTGNALKDYSTTFLLSIVKKFTQGVFVAAFGIGDGAIGVLEKQNGKFELMNIPDGGEFSGQTRFLTMREVVGDGREMLRRIKYSIFDKISFLALMTDGVSDPKFGTDNNLLSSENWSSFAQDLSEAVNFKEEPQVASNQLLEYLDFWSSGEHDDRTLAVLYSDV